MLCVGWAGRNKPLEAEEPQLATTQCAETTCKVSVRFPQTEASSPSDLSHSSIHFLEKMRRSVDKVLAKETP